MNDTHLNSAEIALELTKVYAEHMNKRVEHKYPKSSIDERHIGRAYQFFVQAVQHDIDLLKPKNKPENNH